MRRRMLGAFFLTCLLEAGAAFGEAVSTEELGAPQVARTPMLLLGADLRTEHLAGHPFQVTLILSNPGPGSSVAPDLSLEPQLVAFDIRFPNGSTETRRHAAPSFGFAREQQLLPGARRRVELDVPTGADLPVGSYEITLRLQVGEEEMRVGPLPFRIQASDLVEADFVDDGSTDSENGWFMVWVHRGIVHSSLYLGLLADDAREGLVASTFLMELDEVAHPRIANSRSEEAWDRHIYWVGATGDLSSVKLLGTTAVGERRRVTLPFAEWHPVARGVSDSHGALHLPIWVPRPEGGEVWVVSVDASDRPVFRRVAPLGQEPVAAMGLDSDANLRLCLLSEGALRLFSLGTGSGHARPAREREVNYPGFHAVGEAVTRPVFVGLKYDLRMNRMPAPHGPVLFAWGFVPGNERELVAVWLSAEGCLLRTLRGVAVPPDPILSVLPRADRPPAVLTRDADGKGWVWGAGAPIPAGRVGIGDQLRADLMGRLVVVRMTPGTEPDVSHLAE